MNIYDKIVKYRTSKLVLFILFVLPCFLFFKSFQNNSFKTCDAKLFEIFAMGTEAFVINRIALTDKFSDESYIGLLGRIPELDNIKKAPIKLYKGRSKLDNYYGKFYKYLKEDNFKPYLSNMGIQGNFLAFLYINNILEPGDNFQNYRALFSIVASIVFAFFSFWVLMRLGFLVYLLNVFTIIQLDWIVTSASHMFWFVGLMFVPFVLNLFIIPKCFSKSKKLFLYLFLLNFAFTLLKCLVSGFEIIPTFLVMNTLPIFYFLCLKKCSLKIIGIIFFVISSASILGVSGSMAYQSYKIVEYTGNSSAGLDHLKSSFLRRSKAKIRPNMPQRIKDSYRVSKLDVIKKYLPVEVLSISLFGSSYKIKAKLLILLLVFISIFLGLNQIFRFFLFSNKVFGLLLMNWVALFGSLSMYVVFSSLSYLHPHLVPISWSVPFAISMSLLVGRFVTEPIFNKRISFVAPKV